VPDHSDTNADNRLPVLVVAGLHDAVRRQAVDELLAAYPGAVVLHHDLTDAGLGVAHRVIRTADGPLPGSTATVPLTNDCPCCALRVDLLPWLRRLARTGRHPLAIVDLWGGSEPHAVTEVVAGAEVEGEPIGDDVSVCAVLTAVDPMLVVEQLSVSDLLREHDQHTSGDDERTRAEALARQIEYAQLLVVPRAPHGGGDPEERERRLAGLAMIQQLHPTARRVALGTGALTRVSGSRFDVPAARDRVNPALALLPQQAENCGVATLVWERRRPLHPARLHEALEQLVPAAHRSRGRFWLANRPDMMLAWDAAGGSLAMEECGPWMAALRDERWEVYTPERRAAAALDWDPRYGDRIQQLVFTAHELDVEGVTELLDSCLLTDEELGMGESGWKALPDAFEQLFDPAT
jgi:G3E family GTPase